MAWAVAIGMGASRRVGARCHGGTLSIGCAGRDDFRRGDGDNHTFGILNRHLTRTIYDGRCSADELARLHGTKTSLAVHFPPIGSRCCNQVL